MNQKQLVDAVASRIGEHPACADRAIKAVLKCIVEECSRGGSVTIARFGRFRGVKRKPRKAVNPSTGKTMEIAGYSTIAFTASGKRRVRDEGTVR